MSGDYVIIPWNVVEAWPDLSSSAKAVAVALARHADGDGRSFPSYGTIGREAGLSNRMAIRGGIRDLQRAGLINATRRPNLSTLYQWAVVPVCGIPEAEKGGGGSPVVSRKGSGEVPVVPVDGTLTNELEKHRTREEGSSLDSSLGERHNGNGGEDDATRLGMLYFKTLGGSATRKQCQATVKELLSLHTSEKIEATIRGIASGSKIFALGDALATGIKTAAPAAIDANAFDEALASIGWPDETISQAHNGGATLIHPKDGDAWRAQFTTTGLDLFPENPIKRTRFKVETPEDIRKLKSWKLNCVTADCLHGEHAKGKGQ